MMAHYLQALQTSRYKSFKVPDNDLWLEESNARVSGINAICHTNGVFFSAMGGTKDKASKLVKMKFMGTLSLNLLRLSSIQTQARKFSCHSECPVLLCLELCL